MCQPSQLSRHALYEVFNIFYGALLGSKMAVSEPRYPVPVLRLPSVVVVQLQRLLPLGLGNGIQIIRKAVECFSIAYSWSLLQPAHCWHLCWLLPAVLLAAFPVLQPTALNLGLSGVQSTKATDVCYVYTEMCSDWWHHVQPSISVLQDPF